MPAYAMVVVVEAPNDEEAHTQMARLSAGRGQWTAGIVVEFLGEPWEVKPTNSIESGHPQNIETYNTLDALDQHPWRR